MAMRILGRDFGSKPSVDRTAIDRERSGQLHGIEVGQTGDEQQATRHSMEAEMNAQRDRRTQVGSHDISATR
jgi:hypothetical protein